MLILGNRVDDVFASRIARETGNHVFIATSEKVFAGSYDPSVAKAFEPRLAQRTLAKRDPIFHIDEDAYRSYTYIPLKIVDEDYCLLIESDIGVIRELLAKNRSGCPSGGWSSLRAIAVIGAGLTS